MIAAITNFTWRCLSLSWLTGPIFDKELRVSSRRRRNYVTRSIYLVLLTLFVSLVWAQQVQYGVSSSLYRVSHMARVGKSIITCIVWFQFIAVQIVAGVMLSTSISDEIYNRTLGVLMTTPINSFQIVTGKLLSKLLQTIILMAITLPMLAVIRVFGGVPWDYLLASVSITLTTVIFIGSVSLFYSIFSKRAYIVIILTVLTLAAIYALVPLLAFLIRDVFHHRNRPSDAFVLTVFYANPYFALGATTEQMLSARAGVAMRGFYWYVHCAIVLGIALGLLSFCVAIVRKVALAQATGQSTGIFRRRRRPPPAGAGTSRPQARIKRVVGNAIIWKETRRPLFGRNKIVTAVIASVVLVIILITYGFAAYENALDDDGLHMTFCIIYLLFGMLFTVVLPATVITSEKEARSWPLLLATTLSDFDILLGKFIGILRRVLPAWIPLFVHLAVFTAVGYIHSVAIFQIALMVAGIVLLFAASGLCFSSCFKRTTTAVIMNFSLALTIWALIPFLLGLCAIASRDEGFLAVYINTHPFVQLVLIIEATTSARQPLDYDWLKFDFNTFESTLWMMLCLVFYVVPAALFASGAKAMFRRRTFHVS